MKQVSTVTVERLKALADVLSDPLLPIHDPQGYARSYVEAATLLEAEPTMLRAKSAQAILGKRRLATLRALPKLARAALPDSQRRAVREMRELTTRLAAGEADPALVARAVVIHRAFRGGTYYEVNLGNKRAGIAEALMERPSRRRRRKVNPTPRLSALGIGEAAEIVMRETDELLDAENGDRGGVAERARRVQVIAELVARYPSLIERDYLRRRLGQRRLLRIEGLLGHISD